MCHHHARNDHPGLELVDDARKEKSNTEEKKNNFEAGFEPEPSDWKSVRVPTETNPSLQRNALQRIGILFPPCLLARLILAVHSCPVQLVYGSARCPGHRPAGVRVLERDSK